MFSPERDCLSGDYLAELENMKASGRFTSISKRVARGLMAYMEVPKGDVVDPKRLLDKLNRMLGWSVNVMNLPHNWGFNDSWLISKPSSIYTSVHEEESSIVVGSR